MTKAEKIEVALIPLVGIAGWLMATRLPDHIGIGAMLLGSSGLLLFQGLIRDLWLISRRNRQAQDGSHRQALCMCVESTVGVTGVAAGLVILGRAIDLQLTVDHWVWSALAVTVMVLGYAIKDLVFEWRPFRMRRDKDHVNIVFRLKG